MQWKKHCTYTTKVGSCTFSCLSNPSALPPPQEAPDLRYNRGKKQNIHFSIKEQQNSYPLQQQWCLA